MADPVIAVLVNDHLGRVRIDRGHLVCVVEPAPVPVISST
jgi:hypothetical protein